MWDQASSLPSTIVQVDILLIQFLFHSLIVLSKKTLQCYSPHGSEHIPMWTCVKISVDPIFILAQSWPKTHLFSSWRWIQSNVDMLKRLVDPISKTHQKSCSLYKTDSALWPFIWSCIPSSRTLVRVLLFLLHGMLALSSIPDVWAFFFLEEMCNKISHFYYICFVGQLYIHTQTPIYSVSPLNVFLPDITIITNFWI